MTAGREPRTLAGRYRLDEVIGRGGMSTVYRGTDLELDRTVAVKVALDPLVEQSPIYLARFTREATAGASIDHPGVVTVYDAGADGPTRFIVMEFVPGKSLAGILRERSPLEPAEAADIAAQAADALSAAHARGIVHRDIKPGNIMVTPAGSVKVLDFGIARAVDGGTLTQTATVLGTSAYMSPEQAMGHPADARSDIYSLGCVLYEMLTGKPPFVADVPAAVMHQHVRVKPKPARERNPAIPPALDALVMEMLAKSPADRPQTAAEVRDGLRHAIGNPGNGEDSPTTLAMAPVPVPLPVPVLAPAPIPVAPPPPSAIAPVPEAPAPRTPERPAPRAPQPPPPRNRGRTALWATLAVLAALLLGGAVALALNGTSNKSSSTSGSSSHSTPPLTSSHSSTVLTHSSTSQSTSHSTSTKAPTSSTSRSTTPSTPRTTSSSSASTTTKAGPTTSTSAPTTTANTSTSGGATP